MLLTTSTHDAKGGGVEGGVRKRTRIPETHFPTFRALLFDGNTFQRAVTFGDVDSDGEDELCVGTTSGDILIYKSPSQNDHQLCPWIRVESESGGCVTCLCVGGSNELVGTLKNALVAIEADGFCSVRAHFRPENKSVDSSGSCRSFDLLCSDRVARNAQCAVVDSKGLLYVGTGGDSSSSSRSSSSSSSINDAKTSGRSGEHVFVYSVVAALKSRNSSPFALHLLRRVVCGNGVRSISVLRGLPAAAVSDGDISNALIGYENSATPAVIFTKGATLSVQPVRSRARVDEDRVRGGDGSGGSSTRSGLRRAPAPAGAGMRMSTSPQSPFLTEVSRDSSSFVDEGMKWLMAAKRRKKKEASAAMRTSSLARGRSERISTRASVSRKWRPERRTQRRNKKGGSGLLAPSMEYVMEAMSGIDAVERSPVERSNDVDVKADDRTTKLAEVYGSIVVDVLALSCENVAAKTRENRFGVARLVHDASSNVALHVEVVTTRHTGNNWRGGDDDDDDKEKEENEEEEEDADPIATQQFTIVARPTAADELLQRARKYRARSSEIGDFDEEDATSLSFSWIGLELAHATVASRKECPILVACTSSGSVYLTALSTRLNPIFSRRFEFGSRIQAFAVGPGSFVRGCDGDGEGKVLGKRIHTTAKGACIALVTYDEKIEVYSIRM